jgi:hypothetical protein
MLLSRTKRPPPHTGPDELRIFSNLMQLALWLISENYHSLDRKVAVRQRWSTHEVQHQEVGKPIPKEVCDILKHFPLDFNLFRSFRPERLLSDGVCGSVAVPLDRFDCLQKIYRKESSREVKLNIPRSKNV